jgi:hypothetical protein
MNTLRQSEAGSGSEARRKMVKVSVEVRSDMARFRVGVQAPSIRGALGMVGRSYPRAEVSVVFPIEPEGFFVRDPAAPTGPIGLEQTEREAA